MIPAPPTGDPGADRPVPAPDVVVVGAASRDLVDDDARGWRLGGGVTYSALVTARLGLRTAALVGVDPAAASATELETLRDAGVELVLAPLEAGPVFVNREAPGGRTQWARSRSAPVTPEALPAAWRRAGAWILAPVAGELGPAWADAPSEAALVALGWQGLLRDVRAGADVERIAPGPSALLDRADLVGVSRDDLPRGTVLAELSGFCRPGAMLLLTHGDGGGLAAETGREGVRRIHRYPAVRPDRVADPTGAGDAFLAAVLAARARPGLVGGRIAQRYDLLLASAVASLVVEGPGLAGVPERSAVRRRMAEAAVRGASRSA